MNSRYLLLVVGAWIELVAVSAHAQDIDACINANESAVALRKADKLIEARAALSTCASVTCPDAVRESCKARLPEINRAIPSIVFSAVDPTGRDLTEVAVFVDGKPYVGRLEGGAIELNPGEHEFRLETQGEPAIVNRLVLLQGQQNRREAVVFGATPQPSVLPRGSAPGSSPSVTAAAPQPSPVALPAPHDQTASSSAATTSSGPSRRTVGAIIGGVGAAGLVTGAIFGALSIIAHNAYEQNCGASIMAAAGYCNRQGLSGEKDAANKGNVATAFLIGGAVVLGAGATIFLIAPNGTANPEVGIGVGTLSLRGDF
jgi:hypothetical protein